MSRLAFHSAGLRMPVYCDHKGRSWMGMVCCASSDSRRWGRVLPPNLPPNYSGLGGSRVGPRRRHQVAEGSFFPRDRCSLCLSKIERYSSNSPSVCSASRASSPLAISRSTLESIQFTKAPNVLRGMGLDHLTKTDSAKQQLTDKGMSGIDPFAARQPRGDGGEPV
jgi:hypothetical protein